jgi:hypothetical protein
LVTHQVRPAPKRRHRLGAAVALAKCFARELTPFRLGRDFGGESKMRPSRSESRMSSIAAFAKPLSDRVPVPRAAEGAPTRRSRSTGLAVVSGLAALLLFPASAFAYQLVAYLNNQNLIAGGWASTSGPQYREYNTACRSNNSGQMSVGYHSSAGDRITYSGVQWTNCLQSVYVSIIQSGNFYSRCTNEGGVTFPSYCETTKP